MLSLSRTPRALANFIAATVDFLPEHQRTPYLNLQKRIDQGEQIPETQLIDTAKTLAIQTWPARRALNQFLSNDGAQKEWDMLLEAVRPGTAAVLRRIRKSAGTSTIDETLTSSDATTLITEDMEREISSTRERVQRILWDELQTKLKTRIDQARLELEAMQKRLHALREQAARSLQEQDTLFSKLEQLQERIYFRGESVPLETLDAELQYDIEANEIPAID